LTLIQDNPVAATASQLRQRFAWQASTLITLLVGYGGFYLCRSCLSLVAKQIITEYESAGIDKSQLGLIVSVGLLVYTLGKFVNGLASDFLGGRWLFPLGMIGSALATLWFGWGAGFGTFLVAWAINRGFQSMGWPALMKIASHWYPVRSQGAILGAISLSYLFGDALVRAYLGLFLQWGWDWRQIFQAAALTLVAFAVVAASILRESPASVGLPPVDAPPEDLPREAVGTISAPITLRTVVWPLLANPAFWIVCGVSFGTTLMRETFNFWTPLFLEEVAGVSPEDAAYGSTVFPLVGGISVLVVGAWSDLIGAKRRGVVIAPCILLASVAIGVLSQLAPGQGLVMPLSMLALVSFLMIGPYSLLAGVMALDIGGKRSGATASGLIDGAGYAGAMLSGWGVGKIAEKFGWETAFISLAVVGVFTAGVAALYWFLPSARERA
jgi:OPA family glycerol-3-phosphate transporter-like MFS transporter